MGIETTTEQKWVRKQEPVTTYPRLYRLMIQDGDDDPKPWTVPCTLDQVKGELFRRWFGILVDGRRTTRIEMDPSDAPCHEFAVSYGRGRGRPRGLVWVWVEEDR